MIATDALPAAGFASLRQWFEVAADAMLAVAPEGDVVLVNQRAERLFGYPGGALCGQTLEALVPEPLRDAHRLHRHAYMAHPAMRMLGTGRGLSGQRRDGSQFPIGISLSPVRTERGPLIVATLRDISQSRFAQQAVGKARRERFVLQIGNLVAQSTDCEHSIHQVTELVAAALEIASVAVFSTNWPRTDLSIRAATGLAPKATETLAALFARSRLIGNPVIPGGSCAIALESLGGDRLADIPARLSECGFKDAGVAPLFVHGQPAGALVALAPTPNSFDADRLGFLQSVGNLLVCALRLGRRDAQPADTPGLPQVRHP